MELCFATNNLHKLREIREKLGTGYNIAGLNELGIVQELPENQDTLEGNSEEKARFVYQLTGVDCFADDTGLEVDALNGAPGVQSARYAGNSKDAQKNIKLLLKNLSGRKERGAQFRTVITLIRNNEAHQFEGIVKGSILEIPRGDKGFGYDPVFQPDGYDESFAEMSLALKNTMSHRARALEKLLAFLKNN
jgi:XTP/dITP diphosphohydrolase